MPEEKISWKESNLALIGSDLDKKIKQAAAGGEDAWQSIGDAPGVKVWRIEQFKIVPWPEKDNGCFYQGDSYIVLNSYLIEDRLYRDLYIWIGAESSQDEYGTAAYKASVWKNRDSGVLDCNLSIVISHAAAGWTNVNDTDTDNCFS